jgi:DNA-binding MarR family transcriptional regulator
MKTHDAPSDPEADAQAYAELFPQVYLAFHRRDPKGPELSGASRSVLLHLAQSGPLTVGECARHFERAQSVVSEMIDGLERHGLVARLRDPDDRRRTAVWLTDEGRARIVEEQQVLSGTLLASAFARLDAATRAKLLECTRALVACAPAPRPRNKTGEPR